MNTSPARAAFFNALTGKTIFRTGPNNFIAQIAFKMKGTTEFNQYWLKALKSGLPFESDFFQSGYYSVSDWGFEDENNVFTLLFHEQGWDQLAQKSTAEFERGIVTVVFKALLASSADERARFVARYDSPMSAILRRRADDFKNWRFQSSFRKEDLKILHSLFSGSR